eukprot:jgi/Bigna1/68009/fgenesh1_pg.5_\
MCGRDRQNARLASILPPSASGTTETPETPSRPKVMISNKLDWLGHYTQIVPDSFAFGGTQYQPKSGTVSGLLILRLLEQKGQQFIDEEISRALSASIESFVVLIDLYHSTNNPNGPNTASSYPIATAAATSALIAAIKFSKTNKSKNATYQNPMTVSIKPRERLVSERRNVYCTVAAKLANEVSGKKEPENILVACTVFVVSPMVSLEVDPRLSHDANSIVEEVRALAKILDKHDVDVKSKILFKIPGTWEGILAAKMLTLQEEFSCQVTHVYSMAQATAAADAKVAVIQPYVGRINDWHRCNNADTSSHADKGGDNHGVVLAKKIYNFIHKYELPTKVMAASIRNVKDAISLAGIDYMVLSPLLIKSLASEPGSFEPPVLTPDRASSAQFSPQEIRGSELGECAETLLEASIKASSEAIEKVEEVLANTAIGNL